MSLIGLIDVDGHNFPNLCLMKLSAYHKSIGDTVEWYNPEREMYDLVYKSKVFSAEYSPDVADPLNSKKIKRGERDMLSNWFTVKRSTIRHLIKTCQMKLNISTLIILFIQNIQGTENL